MDCRSSKQNAGDVLLTPLFQELGRLARYSVGEDPSALPIVLLSDSLFRKIKKALSTKCSITDIITIVRCSSGSHYR
jgi:hypothetical protein